MGHKRSLLRPALESRAASSSKDLLHGILGHDEGAPHDDGVAREGADVGVRLALLELVRRLDLVASEIPFAEWIGSKQAIGPNVPAGRIAEARRVVENRDAQRWSAASVRCS